jgi:hypothetical protein
MLEAPHRGLGKRPEPPVDRTGVDAHPVQAALEPPHVA